MKKRVCIFLSMLLILVLTGCMSNVSPKEKVEKFLNAYIQNDSDIILELEEYLDKQDLTNEQRSRYKEIIKDEYSTLKYNIKKETIDGNNATVEVEITVKDLYAASSQAENNLLENPIDFYVDGSYSKEKFINHKLDIMETTKETTTYPIEFNLEKNDGAWHLKEIDQEVLEKIHGIYNYD